MVNSIQFRKLRASVMNEVLVPHGFTRGSHLFIREDSTQIHGIDLQLKQLGGMYTLNVGFSYTFLPAFLGYISKPAAEMELLDLLWFCRPSMLDDKYDQWVSYELPTEECIHKLRDACEDVVYVLDKYALLWRRPGQFLDELPVSLIRNWAEFIIGESPCPPTMPDALRGWQMNAFTTCYFLASVALQEKKPDTAKSYAAAASPLKKSDAGRAALAQLSLAIN